MAHPKKIGKDDAAMDSCTVFNKLLSVANRLDSVESAFKYELTAEPLSLFKGGMMRKADKAALRNFLMPSHLSVSPSSSNICSCRRHGIPCLPSCAECRGEDCLNSAVALDKDRGLRDVNDEEGD